MWTLVRKINSPCDVNCVKPRYTVIGNIRELFEDRLP